MRSHRNHNNRHEGASGAEGLRALRELWGPGARGGVGVLREVPGEGG